MINKKISVKKTIKRGQLLLTLPAFILLIGPMFFSVILLDKDTFTGAIFLITILTSIVSIWLYIGYFSLKWKVWAFDNVNQVHLLRKRANESGLMINDGNWIMNYPEAEPSRYQNNLS